jgi:putative GTP pyrophosphokinase
VKVQPVSVTRADKTLVSNLVKYYADNQDLIKVMLTQLSDAIHGSPKLMAHIHSTKWRLKDPEHLRDKLVRKLMDAKSKKRALPISEGNLFRRINDLAGFRILHLHTRQMIEIDKQLRRVFNEYKYSLLEEPAARTWDDESRAFFREIGIRTVKSPTLYTSVHYVIEANSRTRVTCEIQVRTLAEELWGEVDHTLNYPKQSSISSCQEQIKVLARVTSSCSRLVDSIFRAAE